jgi:hypothetical protein
MFLVQAGMRLNLWNSEQRSTKPCTEQWGVNICRFILCRSACLIHIYVHLSSYKSVTAQLTSMLESTNVLVLTAVDGRNIPLYMATSYCFVYCVIYRGCQFSRVREHSCHNRSTVA